MEEIPELVKALYSLFGENWGRRLGRTIVIGVLIGIVIGVIAGLRPLIGDSYSAIRDFVSQSTIASRIVLALISIFITLTAMVALSLGIAIIITLPIRIGLATRVNTRIDRMLSTLDSLSKDILSTQPDNVSAQQLSSDITVLHREWNTSRITRFTRWWLTIGRWTKTKPRETKITEK